jgi:hypothetical protein
MQGKAVIRRPAQIRSLFCLPCAAQSGLGQRRYSRRRLLWIDRRTGMATLGRLCAGRARLVGGYCLSTGERLRLALMGG